MIVKSVFFRSHTQTDTHTTQTGQEDGTPDKWPKLIEKRKVLLSQQMCMRRVFHFQTDRMPEKAFVIMD